MFDLCKNEPVVGVIGLGLIGGTMAKTVRKNTGCRIIGFDKSSDVISAALSDRVIDAAGDSENISECDIIFAALYPSATIEVVRSMADRIKSHTIVCDCCGIKKKVFDALEECSEKYGFTYIGGHPMAGIEKSGYEYSSAGMFDGASMILCQSASAANEDMERLSEFVKRLGFGRVTRSDPTTHDRIIAYTSQLAHVVSSAYIMSDTSLLESGFSAGSFRDMTRVAWMNEDMWSELFCENKLPLAEEIDKLIRNLERYRSLILNDSRTELSLVLAEGKRRKEKLNQSSDKGSM